jgi:hypothetical protein
MYESQASYYSLYYYSLKSLLCRSESHSGKMNHPASTSSSDDLDVGALRATQSDHWVTRGTTYMHACMHAYRVRERGGAAEAYTFIVLVPYITNIILSLIHHIYCMYVLLATLRTSYRAWRTWRTSYRSAIYY